MYRIGIVGYGAIARGEHVPCIRANSDFELAGVVSRVPPPDTDLPVYADLPSILAEARLDAVALCTPPGIRLDVARRVIDAGIGLLLEKPPASTLGAAQVIIGAAAKQNTVLFATWHSQLNLAVEQARTLLAEDPPVNIRVLWNEDVYAHHAGQEWIWQAGGFGVFDAGINALSVLTRILPEPLIVAGGQMTMGPGGQTPILVRFEARSGDAIGELEFDWTAKAPLREIHIVTRSGRVLAMPNSGRHLIVDGVTVVEDGRLEYPRMYERFAELLRTGQSQADLEPLRIVADAFATLHRLSDTDRQDQP